MSRSVRTFQSLFYNTNPSGIRLGHPNKCGGECKKYKAQRIGKNGSHYAQGNKYCQHCEIFMKWNGGWQCPCCGIRLRGKSFG